MSSVGLKEKVRELVLGMNEIRQAPHAARDIGLREYMGEHCDGATPEQLYSELGIEPQRTQFKDLFADDNMRYLASEIVRDGIRQGMGIAQRERLAQLRESMVSMSPVLADGGSQRFMSPEVFLDPIDVGAVQASFYQDLTVGEEPVSQPTVTVPRMNLADAVLADSDEAATIEEGSITYDSKTVTLQKKARGLKLSYEAIAYNSISLSQRYMQDAGRILGHTLNGMAVTTILNGDVSGGSEAAAVIGVADTDDGITYEDILRAAIRMGLLGRFATQLIGSETSVRKYMLLPEMKERFLGTALLQTKLRSPLVLPDEIFPSTKVSDSKLALQDRSISLVQLTSMPLMVETDKIIMKQLYETAISITTGFAKLSRTASVVIDGSITYAGNEFPSWMAPLA